MIIIVGGGRVISQFLLDDDYDGACDDGSDFSFRENWKGKSLQRVLLGFFPLLNWLNPNGSADFFLTVGCHLSLSLSPQTLNFIKFHRYACACKTSSPHLLFSYGESGLQKLKLKKWIVWIPSVWKTERIANSILIVFFFVFSFCFLAAEPFVALFFHIFTEEVAEGGRWIWGYLEFVVMINGLVIFFEKQSPSRH